jgi:hypothetical protein
MKKEIYEKAAANLRDHPEYASRLMRISDAETGKIEGLSFRKWKNIANCCGTLAYVIGKVNEFSTLIPGRIPDEELKLPQHPESFPGYISPAAGLKFVRDSRNCLEIKARETKPGDFVLFMDGFYWSHAGVYVGQVEGAEMMFAKDGNEGDFQFSDIKEYLSQPDVGYYGFFRLLR